MFGLPHQTSTDFEETLKELIALSPEHISAYALKVEEETPLGRAGFRPDDEMEADLYLLASDLLSRNGYHHYEISNFAKPGTECLHNVAYWDNGPTLGIGLGAASHRSPRRWKNTSDLDSYMSGGKEDGPVLEEDVVLDEQKEANEKIMLGLRLSRGVAADSLHKMKLPVVENFLTEGLAVETKGMYRLTPKGWLLSNQLFHHLV